MTAAWLLLLPAYLLGTLPTAIVVGRWLGHDPTREGSGNPGASNVYRTMGRRAGATVLLADLAKGAAAAALGLATGNRAVGVACGLAAVVGHVAPVTRRFQGGKGVASAAGMTAVLMPLPAVGLTVVWLAASRLADAASAGSIAVAVGLPVAAAVAGRPVGEILAFAVCGALVLARHRDNLERLRRGEERTLTRPGSE